MYSKNNAEMAALELNGDGTDSSTSGNAVSTYGTKRNFSVYTHRLVTRLRRASFLLYQSCPFSLVISRLEVCHHIRQYMVCYLWKCCVVYMYVYSIQAEIESQRLRFHADCCPHVDLGMKHDILNMILQSYNPLWLKIGLEVGEYHYS